MNDAPDQDQPQRRLPLPVAVALAIVVVVLLLLGVRALGAASVPHVNGTTRPVAAATAHAAAAVS